MAGPHGGRRAPQPDHRSHANPADARNDRRGRVHHPRVSCPRSIVPDGRRAGVPSKRFGETGMNDEDLMGTFECPVTVRVFRYDTLPPVPGETEAYIAKLERLGAEAWEREKALGRRIAEQEARVAGLQERCAAEL